MPAKHIVVCLSAIFVRMHFFSFIKQHWQLIIFICFCIITTVLFFYYSFYFTRLAFYKTTTSLNSQTNPVSVVVCARDEAENLANNLSGILLQEYKTTHEVIVVNDNSYDDSEYLLEALRKEYKQMNVVHLTQEAKMIQGKKFPLGVGIKTAKHEILLLTDADCVPATEHWIQSMQAAYKPETEIVLGYGKYKKRKGTLNKLIRWETFHTAMQYLSYALAGQAYMGVGRNLSYKKAVFLRHKGFSAHGNIPGGDDDLFINMAAKKNNVGINVDPKSFTLSRPVETWEDWRKQKNRHYTTSKYYKGSHKFLLGFYALSQLLFYPLAVAASLLYDWRIAGAIIAMKLIWQGILFYKIMDKLEEKDLFPYYILYDIWMGFYYLRFSLALFKKPGDHWK